MNAVSGGDGSGGAAEHAHTTAWIASRIRNGIAGGELTPGTKLSEQSLSAALGVSRNTLRQAFTALAEESIVRRIPNRGVFVASPGPEDVREIYRVRRAIEPAAVLVTTSREPSEVGRSPCGPALDSMSARWLAVWPS